MIEQGLAVQTRATEVAVLGIEAAGMGSGGGGLILVHIVVVDGKGLSPVLLPLALGAAMRLLLLGRRIAGPRSRRAWSAGDVSHGSRVVSRALLQRGPCGPRRNSSKQGELRLVNEEMTGQE